MADNGVEAAVPAATEQGQPTRLPLHQTQRAFTIIELLVVVAIIIVLAGLILATSGYVQTKGRRSRAEAEIAAMSAALENYKADNGIYPQNDDTKDLDPVVADQAAYANSNLFLYESLTGDTDYDRQNNGGKSYFAFKPNQLSPRDQSANVAFISDPFGNPYGYSTAKASAPSGRVGNNPTFDLWSVADGSAGADQSKWVKNW